MLKQLSLIACLTFLLQADTRGDAPEFIDHKRFEKKVIATELIQPMELAIAPDGHIYLIEIGGTIKHINTKTREIKSVGKIAVTTEQENGLIGLALDPQFEKNNWLYLQYSPPNFSGQHVSRFTVKNHQLSLILCLQI